MGECMIQKYEMTTLQVVSVLGIPKVDKREWFVAIVNNHSEKKCAKALLDEQYETFVPTQSERHTWNNGTVKVVDRVLIATVIFIHCTESERREIVKRPFIKRFMVDKTRIDKHGKHPIVKIPGYQIDNFRNLLEKANELVAVDPFLFAIGDRVKVVSGELAGIEGRILRKKFGETFLIVEIGLLGCAKLSISLDKVQKIDS